MLHAFLPWLRPHHLHHLPAFFRGDTVLAGNSVWLEQSPLGSGLWRNIGPLSGFLQCALLFMFFQIPLRNSFAYLNVLPQLPFVFFELIPYLKSINPGQPSRSGPFLSPNKTIQNFPPAANALLLQFKEKLKKSIYPQRLSGFFPAPAAILSAELVPITALSSYQSGHAEILFNGTEYALNRESARPMVDVFLDFAQVIKNEELDDILTKNENIPLSVKSDFDDLLTQHTVSCLPHSTVLYADERYQVHYSEGCLSLIQCPTERNNHSPNHVYQGMPLVGTTRHELLSTIPRTAGTIEEFWSDQNAGWSWKETGPTTDKLFHTLMEAKCSDAESIVKWVSQ